MTTTRANEIAAEFATAQGYTVTADAHGLLVREMHRGKPGRTSYFMTEANFWRHIETVAAAACPIS